MKRKNQKGIVEYGCFTVACMVALVLLLVAVFAPMAMAEGEALPEPAEGVAWLDIVSGLLYGVLAAVIPVITAFVAKGLNALKVWIGDKADNELVQHAINEALDAVKTAVAYVNQTYVDALKGKNIFNAAEQREALRKAREAAIGLMSEYTIDTMEFLYGDISDWLALKIEQEVGQEKKTAVGTATLAGEIIDAQPVTVNIDISTQEGVRVATGTEEIQDRILVEATELETVPEAEAESETE